jgi:hypothetical protein
MSTSASGFTADEILQQLDACAKQYTFPMLDNGYVYLVDTRLNAYRDATRWAMIIEIVGFSFRTGVPYGMQVVLYCFGNCLRRSPGTANEDFLWFVKEDAEKLIFDDESSIRPSATSIQIRDQMVSIPRDPEAWTKKGIVLQSPPAIQPYELMRVLVPEHRHLFLARDVELQQRIPTDLPLFLRLNEWNHPDLSGDSIPSRSRTFQMLAEAITAGDHRLYRPTEPPNTHWSNWPESGTL